MNLSKILMLFVLAAALSSCSTKKDETATTNTGSMPTEQISKTDYTETDEDLFTVDYKEFYDQLAPHGEWIEVTGSDVGLNIKNTASIDGAPRKVSFVDFFGVNSAYAADVTANSFFIWKPAADLSLGLTTGIDGVNAGVTAGTGSGSPTVSVNTATGLSVTPTYVPYTNGQWINTEEGWSFKAPTAYEETTSHYGRWNYSPALGWTWLPGRVYSPAWVDWKEDDNNIAWAPLPPSTYIINNTVAVPVIPEYNYIIVEKKSFVEPSIYKYMYKENKNRIMIKEMRKGEGIMVKNSIVYNIGPDVTMIRKITNLPLEPVKVQYVTNIKEVKNSGAGYSVFAPQFVKFKGKANGHFVKPGKYVEYKQVKNPNSENKNEEMKNDSKKNDENKGSDDKEKPNKEKSKEDKDKEKIKKEKGPDKEKKEKDDKEKKNDKKNDDKKNDDKGKDKNDDKGKKK